MNLARLCARLKPVFLSKKGPSKARLLIKMSSSEELGTLEIYFLLLAVKLMQPKDLFFAQISQVLYYSTMSFRSPVAWQFVNQYES